jgi:hypothetical protein
VHGSAARRHPSPTGPQQQPAPGTAQAPPAPHGRTTAGSSPAAYARLSEPSCIMSGFHLLSIACASSDVDRLGLAACSGCSYSRCATNFQRQHAWQKVKGTLVGMLQRAPSAPAWTMCRLCHPLPQPPLQSPRRYHQRPGSARGPAAHAAPAAWHPSLHLPCKGGCYMASHSPLLPSLTSAEKRKQQSPALGHACCVHARPQCCLQELQRGHRCPHAQLMLLQPIMHRSGPASGSART